MKLLKNIKDIIKISRVSVLLLVAGLIVAVAGYIFVLKTDKLSRSNNISAKNTKQKQTAHNLPKKLEKEILDDVRDNLTIIQSAETDTSMLKNALADQALSAMYKNITDDLKKNVATRRKFDDIKLYISNYTKGVAAFYFEFTDMSYNYDVQTKKILSQPPASKKKLALAVQKINKKWKIIGIYNIEAKKKSKK